MEIGSLSLGIEEFRRRHALVRRELQKRGLEGLVVFAAPRVLYLSGFAHLPTERPVALVLPLAAEPAMLVPALEAAHLAARVPWLQHVRVYPEYPGLKHPMRHLAELLSEVGLSARPLGADRDGYGDHMGYRGPPLSAVTGQEVTRVGDMIDNVRLVKSPAELALLRTSGHWSAVSHRHLQEEMATGQTEIEISRRAEQQASDRLVEKLAQAGHLGGAATVHASFRAGPRTAMAHAMMGNRPLAVGDNMVSYCVGTVAGYHTELERTMFVGAPSRRQRELFAVVVAAQALALETIRPGLRCADVEAAVGNFLLERGYEAFIKHHTGHGLGLEFHEGPFLDLGDETILQPGMVLSVEPGLYVPGLGGFRHSDTVVVQEGGVEILTEYPRTLDELIIDL